MILNTLFDVMRGWPHGSALDERFTVYAPGGTPVEIIAGSVIYLRSDSTVDLADGPLAAIAAVPTWVVVEGNDDYSGTFIGKVVALRGTCMLKLDPDNFVAGAYPVGTLLSFDNGQFKPATVGLQVIGEVVRDNLLTDTTIDVMYHGGLTKAL